MTVERLRNENEGKTKTQMMESFNQYSENETEVWRQNILNQFNRVSSSFFVLHFVITLIEKCERYSLLYQYILKTYVWVVIKAKTYFAPILSTDICSYQFWALTHGLPLICFICRHKNVCIECLLLKL